MNNAAAITAVNRALAHYRRRQAHFPTNHSAREIAQMSMLAEYLHETYPHDSQQSRFQPMQSRGYEVVIVPAAA